MVGVDVARTGSASRGRTRTAAHVLLWTLALWLPAAAAVTVAAALGYGIGQNLLRSSANDPQVQVSSDAAARLAAGDPPASVTRGPTVDLATSLAVAVTVVDADGTVLASSGRLDGQPARPPQGALDAAADHQNVVTWQPRPGVRMAAVITAWSTPDGSGTVVATRSLRLVEQRVTQLTLLVAAGWLAGLAATGLAAFVASWILPARPSP
ncbi:hypothetical protein [Cellulomonas sp. ICMP 17802]|uniref:hypothetical protein n=1 Tax=Cellulomonas sp. ICMP 17802 TaxID=3239199 RepID=UPI00351AB2E1